MLDFSWKTTDLQGTGQGWKRQEPSLLLGDLREGWVVLALCCAVPKYVLVLFALAYLGIGGLLGVISAASKRCSR